MDEKSFSYKTLRNSFYLFLNFLLPLVFTIFVTRTSALKLGPEEYGIFLLVNAISTFINFVDLGLGTAVTKYAAEYIGSGNKRALEDLLSSSRTLFLFTGILGLIVFFVLGKWFLPAFHVGGGSASHIFMVFLFAGAAFLLNSLNTIYSAALTALQRYDLLSKFSLLGLAVNSIGTIILLELNFRLKAIMALNAVLTFVTLIVFHYFVKKLMPELKLSFKIVRSEIKKAYGFGFLAFVSNLASSSLIYLDRLLIPIFLGPAQLPFYGVPGNVALKTSVVTNSFGGMLFPMASELYGAGQMEKLKNVYIRAFRNLHVVSAAVTVAIALFAEKILYFWIGAEYAEKGTQVLVVLAFTYFIVALYVPLQGLLLGLGQMKFLIKQSAVMAVLNLALLLVLLPKFGIMGAAVAYLFSVLPMAYAFYWSEKNIFQISGQAAHYLKLYLKLIFTGFLDAAIIYFLLLPLVGTVWSLVIIGPLSVLLYMFLYHLLGFTEKEDTDLIKNFLRKFLRLPASGSVKNLSE